MRWIYLFFFVSLYSTAQAQTNAYENSLRLYKQNQPDSAAYYADQAVFAYTERNVVDSVVFAYTQKALVAWDVSGAETALRTMDSALLWVKKLPAKNNAALAAYCRLAQIYTQQQVFDKAGVYFKQAAKAKPLQDTLNRHVVAFYSQMAMFYLMQDLYDNARPYAKQAYHLNLLMQGKDGVDMPSILQTIYYISQYSEHYEEALTDGAEFQRVMALHYPPDHRSIGVMHNSLGNIYEALLRYEDALYHRRKALEIQVANYSKNKANGFSLANAYHNIGNLYSYINEDFLAQEYLSRGSILFEDAYGTDGLGMVKIWVAVASGQVKLKMWQQADTLFKKAYALQQKLAPADYHAIAYVETFYGDWHLHQKQYAGAEQWYRKAIANFKKSNTHQLRLALQTEQALAEVMAVTGRLPGALQISRNLLSAFRKLYPKGNDGIANKLFRISGFYQDAGLYKDALAYSDSVFIELTGSGTLNNDSKTWMAHIPFSYNSALYIQQRMELLQQLNRQSSSEKLLKNIIELANQYGKHIAANLPAYRSQATLMDLATVNKAIYSMAVEACWQLSGNGQKQDLLELAFEYSERSKAFLLRLAANNLLVDAAAGINDKTALRDHYFRKQIAELNAAYLDEAQADSVLHRLTITIEAYRIFQDSMRASENTLLAAKYRLNPYTVSEVRQQLLGGDASMLEYMVTETAVFSFLVNDKNLVVKRASREGLKDLQLLQRLNTLSVTAFNNFAYPLYEVLIKPVEEFFSSHRLLIVPDAELYQLNFELLITGKQASQFSDMPYLVKKYDISYILSAASAIAFKQAQHLREYNKALVFAPVFTDEMKQLYLKGTSATNGPANNEYLYLHRQPFALEAALQMARYIPNDLYREQQAEEWAFKQAASKYQLLHLGTHAEVNNVSQLQSRFFFAQPLPGDSSHKEDGYLHVYEIYAMQLKAELAVLTACETGLGTFNQGEGVVSLAHSFMHAGCKSVIMSLWRIDEKASMSIITKFYNYLSKGYSKNEALRAAKLALLTSDDQRMAHPYYWAGLTLIGDNETVFPRSRLWLYALGGAIVLPALFFTYRRFRKPR